MLVQKIMSKKVISISPEAPIMDAVTVLSRNGISGLPVVRDGNVLVGIITEYDIMKRLIEYYIPSYMTLLAEAESGSTVSPRRIMASAEVVVRDIMTKKVFTVKNNADAIDAARLITKYDINPIPVVGVNDEVVGIVSRSDIVKYAVEVFPTERLKQKRKSGNKKKK